ncbi:MAG: hypothetical protein K2I33_01675 [Oscillospiraceae bacterium]|nr:hypothetical protein [Oscillospiraceae bacterium]
MDNNNMFDTEDLTGNFDTNDIEQNKAISAVAYIPILFIVPMLATQSPYAKFHANQGLILTMTCIILNIASRILGFVLEWVPILPTLVSAVFSLTSLALLIIGIINAVQGKAKKLPIVGGLLNVIH